MGLSAPQGPCFLALFATVDLRDDGTICPGGRAIFASASWNRARINGCSDTEGEKQPGEACQRHFGRFRALSVICPIEFSGGGSWTNSLKTLLLPWEGNVSLSY